MDIVEQGAGDAVHIDPAVASQPKRQAFTVTLDGFEYAIDPSQYRHQGVSAIREGITSSVGDPSEALYDHSGTWWRHAFDWSNGRGQRAEDFVAGVNPSRFRDSVALDNTRSYELTLSPEMQATYTSASVTILKLVVGYSGHAYAITGTGTVLKSNSSTDYSAWTAITGLTGTAIDIATDGLDVYVATSTRVYKIVAGASSGAAIGTSTAGYTMVAVIANRVLAARSNVLLEVLASSETIIKTMPANFDWSVAFGIGSLIYVGGQSNFAFGFQDGLLPQLYTIKTLDDGSLVLGPLAAPFGIGEWLLGAVSHSGLVAVLTSSGMRIAEPGADGTLTYGPLFGLENSTMFPQAYIERIPPCASDGMIWFAIRHNDGGTAVSLMRCDLSTFIEPLVPAHNFDLTLDVGAFLNVYQLNARGYGHYPDVVCEHAGVDSFIYEARALWTDRTQLGIPLVTVGFVPAGSLSTGEIRFGTTEQKRVTRLILRFDALRAGEEISFSLVDHLGAALGSGTADTVGSVGISVDLDGQLVDWVELTLTLANTNGTRSTTPRLHHWEIRAFPIPSPTEQFLVPLILKDEVLVGSGQGGTRSVMQFERVQALRKLWLEKTVVLYQDGPVARRVRVDNFQITGVNWSEAGKLNGGYFDIVALVQLLSV